MRLILASGSPRRAELVKMVAERVGDVQVLTLPSRIDEVAKPCETAKEFAQRLATEKAQEVYQRIVLDDQDAVVLGSDTVVTLDGEIFGKPRDAWEAHAMFKRLCGNTHTVLTAVCLVGKKGTLVKSQSARVGFGVYDKDLVQAYIMTGSPLDKAGGYGLQDEQLEPLITNVEGDRYTIIGLPVDLVVEMLREYKSWH